MKKLNKKGFTLVELLAVVVILAVLMLVAVTAVGPAIANSKKSGFFSSVSSMIDAATIYAASEGVTTTTCIKASTLSTKGYLSLKDAQFKGAVLITASGGAVTGYTALATNGDYSIGTVNNLAGTAINISTMRTGSTWNDNTLKAAWNSNVSSKIDNANFAISSNKCI